jgi:hypothetical protein
MLTKGVFQIFLTKIVREKVREEKYKIGKNENFIIRNVSKRSC